MDILKEKLADVRTQQKTIDDLLTTGEVVSNGGCKGDWKLTPLVFDKDCDVGFVDIAPGAGKCPDHVHVDAIEYLVVVKGSIMFNLEGKDVRVIETGGIAVVPPNKEHHSRPLEDGTRLVYVCVPRDEGMQKLVEDICHG